MRFAIIVLATLLPGAASAADWAFRHVNVVTMDAHQEVLENQAVVVSQGKIVALGTRARWRSRRAPASSRPAVIT